MAKFNTGQSFTDGDTVTGAKLNNITSQLDIYSGVIADQTAIAATVSTADLLLLADTDAGSSGAVNKVTVQKLLDDTLTNGTFTNANLAAFLTYGTATGNRTISTSATITTGTITTGVIPTGTFGTTTSTAATITNGVITNGTITTGLIPTLTVGTTTGTSGIFTSGTIATLNSTTGTIATLNSTTGTIGALNSTTGTIGNLSTTLAGDFTISQGTGTLGTSGVTLGTYGSTSAIPFLTVNAKGIITAATSGTFSSTPADGSITAPKLSGAQTGSAPIYGARAWVSYNQVIPSVTASANVSSVTDNSTGIFTVNFLTQMPSAEYVIAGSAVRDDASGINVLVIGPNSLTPRTTGSCRLMSDNVANTKEDGPRNSVTFLV